MRVSECAGVWVETMMVVDVVVLNYVSCVDVNGDVVPFKYGAGVVLAAVGCDDFGANDDCPGVYEKAHDNVFACDVAEHDVVEH